MRAAGARACTCGCETHKTSRSSLVTGRACIKQPAPKQMGEISPSERLSTRARIIFPRLLAVVGVEACGRA